MYKLILILSVFINSHLAFGSTIGEAELLDRMSRQSKEAVQISQIAAAKSMDRKVQRFAKSVISFHERNQRKINTMQIRWYANVKLPGRAIASLDTSSFAGREGKEFDRAYLRELSQHHKKEIENMGLMMPNVDKRAVHHLALKTVKRLGSDISRMEKLAQGL